MKSALIHTNIQKKLKENIAKCNNNYNNILYGTSSSEGDTHMVKITAIHSSLCILESLMH